MKDTISLNWQENMAFETEVNGHKLVIDAYDEVGGQDKGPRPKPLILVSLGGCTAMDVISILKKMKVKIEGFKVHVEGDLTEEHPKRFSKMHVIYEFKGKDLPMAKLKKAISLSEERYCGISATLKDVVVLTSEIKIIE